MKAKIRWFILTLVFIATGLNFLDRQVLSMTIIKIQDELNITDVQYGIINTSFLISYALMFTIGGRLIDKIGGKLGLALSVGIWSTASMLHGIITGFYHLLTFRFLLGVGEGGCFPGAAKTVYEWFGRKERALANGIAIGGSAIGAVVAPPLTILISANYGWRWTFIIPGIFGILWVLAWMTISWRNKRADTHDQEDNVQLEQGGGISFLEIIKSRSARVLVLMRFLLDPVFYFLMFWVPKYLSEERGLSFDRIGELFWIPFMALGISNIIGGWISDKLIANNLSVNAARKWVMGSAALLTLIAPFISRVSSVELAVGFMAIMMFAHGFWITNYITVISDIFGKYATSTVVGLSGTAGALAGVLVNPLIGMVVQKYSYGPLWMVAGIMYPLAFLIMLIFIPNLNPLAVRSSSKIGA